MFQFAKEMNFVEKAIGNKSNRDKSLIRLLQSLAKWQGHSKGNFPPHQTSKTKKQSKTRWLSSDPTEFFRRLRSLLQEKQAGNKSNITTEEIVVTADKLFKYQFISRKQHRFLIDKCLS